jgi:hypothetical protein
MPSPRDYYAPSVHDRLDDRIQSLLRTRNERLERENADLRDRLALLAQFVCTGCGCAAGYDSDQGDCECGGPMCSDCALLFYERFYGGPSDNPEDSAEAASISVGMRALCGRSLVP